MTKNRAGIGLVVIAVLALAGWSARTDSAAAEVEEAVANYVDALYDVRPELIDRSVHPQLVKLGFVRSADGSYRQASMTFTQLRELAGRWNAGGRVDPSAAPRTITVLDVLDQTATAKLQASWGTDYLQLGLFDGQWQVIHVLWQSAPAQ